MHALESKRFSSPKYAYTPTKNCSFSFSPFLVLSRRRREDRARQIRIVLKNCRVHQVNKCPSSYKTRGCSDKPRRTHTYSKSQKPSHQTSHNLARFRGPPPPVVADLPPDNGRFSTALPSATTTAPPCLGEHTSKRINCCCCCCCCCC